MRALPKARLDAAVRIIAVLTLGTAVVGTQSGGTAIPKSPDDKTIVHVLNRIGFGPTPGSISEIRRDGLEAYIARQLQPERMSDDTLQARLAGFTTLTMSTRELAADYFLPAQMRRREAQRAAPPDAAMREPSMQPLPAQTARMEGDRRVLVELAEQKLLRAIYSERQLEEVMVDFWFNHFNVFVGKGQTRVYLTEYERDTIRPRVFGKFRDLLGAVAESPAMLIYLDNWQSSAPDAAETSMPDRRPRPLAPQPANRRRGINENYARELMELHTLGVDGGYTQKDVQEVARAFTGWTVTFPLRGGGFLFDPRRHDDGAKVVLGIPISRGGGKKDGEQVLDILAKHPSTARFIATKLARRFVSDDPPKTLVDRAAARFRETDGDIREVVRTIVTSREFFDAGVYRVKVKTPFEFVASAVRGTGLDLANAGPLVQATRQLGMPLYGCQPPTGYADRAEAWVNTGALLNRMNFALTLSSNRVLTRRREPVSSSRVEKEILAGDLSQTTRATVAKAAGEPQRLALLLGSPEFQKR